MLACKVGSTLICWLGRAKGGNKKGKKDKERVALGPETCEGGAGRRYSVDQVVGVWRDYKTGERMAAVVWEEGDADGGTWETFSTLQLGDQAPTIGHGTGSDDEDMVRWLAIQCAAIQCAAIQCAAIQCAAIQCAAIQCAAI